MLLFRHNFPCFGNLEVLVVLLVLFMHCNVFADTPQRIGAWDNVSGFAMHPAEDHIVLAIMLNETEKLFESQFDGNSWSDPAYIRTLNDHGGGLSNIGGPSFNYNGTVLYFHADYPGGHGGYDLYRSVRTEEGWGKPENIGAPVNSSADALYPAVAPGNELMFFSLANPGADIDKPRRTPDCQVIMVAYRGTDGVWENPETVHDVINRACEFGAHLAIDGKTLYFSAVDQDNHRDSYNIYVARKIFRGTWHLPQLIRTIASDKTLLNPVVVNNSLYYLEFGGSRRDTGGRVLKVPLNEEYQPLPIHFVQGTVRDLATGYPLVADFTVFDPTTLEVLGEFGNDKSAGEFSIPLLDGQNYIVDVRKPGYSFASFQPDFRGDEPILGPSSIELFDQAELRVSVYDGEIFRPLEATVWAEIQGEQGKVIHSTRAGEGVFAMDLPIGYDYLIKASAEGFQDNGFTYSLRGDVVFGRFFRDSPMEPVTVPVNIIVRDAETTERVQAEVLVENVLREESFLFSPDDLVNGEVTAILRDADEYEFTVRRAEGYSFFNDIIAIHSSRKDVFIDLAPLRTEVAVRLNNIHFATNSAELTAESFAELDRVVDLIDDNPTIVIEISAHTDDVGTDAYNLLLSDRRAQSVVNYLLDNEVPEDRLVARGYGLRQPLVPNTSDENRALNRRVEFTILRFREESE